MLKDRSKWMPQVKVIFIWYAILRYVDIVIWYFTDIDPYWALTNLVPWWTDFQYKYLAILPKFSQRKTWMDKEIKHALKLVLP